MIATATSFFQVSAFYNEAMSVKVIIEEHSDGFVAYPPKASFGCPVYARLLRSARTRASRAYKS